MTRKEDFIRAILEMNYGTLMSICEELAGACEDKEARPLPSGGDSP